MMKPTIDQSAVAALATAALWDSPRKFPIDGDWHQPEQLVYQVLGMEGQEFTKQGLDDVDIAVTVSEAAFLLGLHLGARIGADPSHVPNVKDLVAEYRIKPKMKVA